MISAFTFLSSNDEKISQYRSFNLTCAIKKGPDLQEIYSHSDEIIVHKSKMAGPGNIVEDSIIIVDGVEIVDVKWRYKEFFGREAVWKTSIGLNDGENIYVFSASIPVLITKDDRAIGFEDNIIPLINSDNVLKFSDGLDRFTHSARGIACSKLLKWEPSFVVPIDIISDWAGKWQRD